MLQIDSPMRVRSLAFVVSVAFAVGLLILPVATEPARGAVADIFTAHLTAEAEVPDPGPEGATGTADLFSYHGRVEICYEITLDGLPPGDIVTTGHIHAGEEGVAGDVVLPLFTEPPTGDPISGCVQDFDGELQDALLANPGAYYVNIHTEAYPDGAVRGQVELTAPGVVCTIIVDPSTVAVGEQFVVTGDFGGPALIYLVAGRNAALPEGSEPVVAAPATGEIRVTLTAEAGDIGRWTVWAVRPETRGCADSAALTISAASPDTAVRRDIQWLIGAGLAFLAFALISISRTRRTRGGSARR